MTLLNREEIKMKYLFFVNVQKDDAGYWLGFSGYQSGHALELAYAGEIAADSEQAATMRETQEERERFEERDACNRLFEKFNINHPSDYRNRSMSVGDVIVFDNRRAYACESVGWKEIPIPAEAHDCPGCNETGNHLLTCNDGWGINYPFPSRVTGGPSDVPLRVNTFSGEPE
jgi:hypothetical protein